MSKRDKKGADIANLYRSIVHDGEQNAILDVEITAANPIGKFFIELDGDVYGPFQKIRIEPALHASEDLMYKPLTLPVMSFFPVETLPQ
jgi:hypothetical protein